MQRFIMALGVLWVVSIPWHVQAQTQNRCVPPDPDYCVTEICGIGDGDCDPGQCNEGVCVNDVGAQYGLPAHYDVCEARGSGGGNPGHADYCRDYGPCGAGVGDCDPGQCAAGLVCVNDVGAQYGLPAHYDVCEAQGTTPPADGVGQFVGTWRFTNRLTTQAYRFAQAETCRGSGTDQCLYDDAQGAVFGAGQILEYFYLLIHPDGNICRTYWLHEPTGNTVTGHYGYGIGHCLNDAVTESIARDVAFKRYPTTGLRISQSAAQARSREQDAEAGVSSAEQDAIKQAIEELFDVMTD